LSVSLLSRVSPSQDDRSNAICLSSSRAVRVNMAGRLTFCALALAFLHCVAAGAPKNSPVTGKYNTVRATRLCRRSYVHSARTAT